MALRFCKRKWSCAISLPPGEMTILSLCSRDCDVIFGIAVATVRGTADVRLQVHGRRLDGGPFTRIEHPRIAVYPFSARKPFHAHMLSDAAVELCAQNPSPDSKAKLRVYWNKAIFADERDRPRCDEGQAYEQEFGREEGASALPRRTLRRRESGRSRAGTVANVSGTGTGRFPARRRSSTSRGSRGPCLFRRISGRADSIRGC